MIGIFLLSYPTLPGGITVGTTIPEYVRYAFNFSLFIGLVGAVLVLIYNGFRYLTSRGNPSVLREAKEKIVSVFVGLAILMGAYLILFTINPALVKLKAEPPSSSPVKEVEYGVRLKDGNKKTLRVFDKSASDLGDYIDPFKVRYADTVDKPGELPYLGIVFQRPYFGGKCAFIFKGGSDMEDNGVLDTKGFSKSYPRSLYVAQVKQGCDCEVTFYDSINCHARKGRKDNKLDGAPGGLSAYSPVGYKDFSKLKWPVMSFKIKGPCWAVLSTKTKSDGNLYPPSSSFPGDCQLFLKSRDLEEKCFNTFKATSLYNPNLRGRIPGPALKPREALFFCSPASVKLNP